MMVNEKRCQETYYCFAEIKRKPCQETSYCFAEIKRKEWHQYQTSPFSDPCFLFTDSVLQIIIQVVLVELVYCGFR